MRHRKTKTITLAAVLAALISVTVAQVNKPVHLPMTGQWIVVDGDTLKSSTDKIRLWGIDAPELHQTCKSKDQIVACGKQAKEAMIALVKDHDVTCEMIDLDRYQRKVSRCLSNGKDISEVMTSQGWALDYTQYSHGEYLDEQELAQKEKKGIWAYQFDKPADWRKGNRRY